MKAVQLMGRGLRYIRRHGVSKLYYKVKERRERNQAEKDYDAWYRAQEPDEQQWEAERLASARFARTPVISILVPAYETPEPLLREMIESVLGQSYERLELCIADGSPSAEGIGKTVSTYAERDPRVRYRKLEQNLGIAENTNAALEMASGEYVGLLDHDDLLLPGALFAIVRALNEAGWAEVIYTDEDKLTPGGERHFQPHFKPDYNPEYLRSTNYICHFFVAERNLALAVGGFRREFDGAQDHDFILRCTERAARVLHVPKVLYSWRESAGSTATNPESKLYAYESGKRAVRAQLERLGESGEVTDTDNYGFYRTQYAGYPAALRKSFEFFHGQTDVKVVYYDKICNNSVTIPNRLGTAGETREGAEEKPQELSGDSLELTQEPYLFFTCVPKMKVNEGFLNLLKAAADRPGGGCACARVYDIHGRLRSDVHMAGAEDPFSMGMKGLKRGYTGYFHRAVLQQELDEPTDCFLVRRELLEGETADSAGALAAVLKKKGLRLLYEPWAVAYEVR